MYLFLKVLITSIVVVLISEISRRSTIFAGILASIPLTSLLAISWIYMERQDKARDNTIISQYNVNDSTFPSFFCCSPLLPQIKD
tara:strand:+ start:457 stop:711 length:255 start_codon:yes stop_codon:yes gene_type:complete